MRKIGRLAYNSRTHHCIITCVLRGLGTNTGRLSRVTNHMTTWLVTTHTPAKSAQQLRQIWELSDADGDSKLSLAEFCIGMHLIVCVSKKGLAIPATVPRNLALAGSGSGPATSPAQVRGASPSTPASQSPSMRRAPGMQSLSTPPAGPGFSSLGGVTSSMGTGDAFRWVATLFQIVTKNQGR